MKSLTLTPAEVSFLKKRYSDLYGIVCYLENSFNQKDWVICQIYVNGHDVSQWDTQKLKDCTAEQIQSIQIKLEKSDEIGYRSLQTLIDQLDEWINQLESFEPRHSQEIVQMGYSILEAINNLQQIIGYLLLWSKSYKKNLSEQLSLTIQDLWQQINQLPKFDDWKRSETIWFWIDEQVLPLFKEIRFELNRLWDQFQLGQFGGYN